MQLSDKNIISDMRTAYGKTLVELGSKDPNIVCVGADTTDSLKTSSLVTNSPIGYTMLGLQKQILFQLLLDWQLQVKWFLQVLCCILTRQMS